MPKKQKKINRTVAVITIVTVIPSLIIGAYTVYTSYIEHSIEDYLESEFVFSDTQLVQSSVDQTSRTITVSLVGKPVSDEAIAMLEQELANYSLSDYRLRVTQNSVYSVSDAENTDKITIALQENTISELQQQLAEQDAKLEELGKSIAAQVDFEKTAEKAASIFTDLTNCHCGILADGGEEYMILVAGTERELTEAEIQVIENWLKAESGLTRAKLFLI